MTFMVEAEWQCPLHSANRKSTLPLPNSPWHSHVQNQKLGGGGQETKFSAVKFLDLHFPPLNFKELKRWRGEGSGGGKNEEELIMQFGFF